MQITDSDTNRIIIPDGNRVLVLKLIVKILNHDFLWMATKCESREIPGIRCLVKDQIVGLGVIFALWWY